METSGKIKNDNMSDQDFYKFAFVERSRTMKAPVGLLSDRTVLRSKMEGLCPDKFQFAEPTRRLPQPSAFPAGWGHPALCLIVKMCSRGGHTKSKLLILNSTLQLRLPH